MSATTIIINDETPRRQYTASAGQTVFDFPFPFFADGDLEVYLTPNGSQPNDTTDIQTIVTDYTVTGADTQNGGQITLTSGASAGDIITILRVVDIDRTADYQAAGDLLAETLNAEQDTEIMISQQLREEANRAIRSQKSDVTLDMTLPSAADRADTLLQFDVNGKPDVISTTDLVAGLSGAILGANYVTNTAVGDGSTVNFTVSVAPGAKGNIQIYIDGVYQNKASFSISGTTVTFTEAPPLNASVEFIIGYSIGSYGDAGDVTFTQAGTGAVTRTVEDKLYEFVSVKDFGAVGDGVTDDTAAFQAAITEATSQNTTLFVPDGNYKLNTTSPLELDLGVMSMVSLGNAVLDFSGSTSTYALWVYSSKVYPVSHYQNTSHRLQGFVCKGAGSGGVKGLQIQHPTYNSNTQFKIESCSFYNFDINLYLKDNAWRVSFINSVFLTGHAQNILIDTGTNAGESIDFDHCMIADGGDFEVANNGVQVNAYSTSFLNTRILVSGSNNRVNLYGGNLENPGSALAYQYIRIDGGSTNVVTLFGTPITVNTTTWSSALMYVASNNFLKFVGVQWPDMQNYNSIATSTGYLQFVDGSGIVSATASTYWPTGGGPDLIVSKEASSLYNGDFETGNTNGWTVTPYGTAGSTAVADAAAKNFGTYGLLVTSVAGGGINITQSVACKAGQLVQVAAFAKLATSAATPAGYIQVFFKSTSGDTISSYGEEITSTSWTTVAKSMTRTAPKGTASAVMTLNAQPGGNVIHFDNIALVVA